LGVSPGTRLGVYEVTAPIGEGVSTPLGLLATGPSKAPRRDDGPHHEKGKSEALDHRDRRPSRQSSRPLFGGVEESC
jgi:hypothetical protein